MRKTHYNIWFVAVLGCVLGLFMLASPLFAADEASPSTYSISTDQALEAIAKELHNKGAGDRLEVTITSRANPVLHSANEAMQLHIGFLDYNARSGKWDSELEIVKATDPSQVLTTLSLSGRYDELTEVPVLKMRMHNKDVIQASDIDWENIARDRISRDTILTEDELIGMSPRRTITPGKAIRQTDLMKPIIMEKGAVVRMSFTTPVMNIQTVGEALGEGAYGDTIGVRNLDSQIVV